MFELTVHAKAKAWVFPKHFAVILSAAALPIMLKGEFKFELILYITINFLFSKVQAAALIPELYSKFTLESAPIVLFSSRLKEEKLFPWKIWGLRSTWSSILRPPKHLFLFFLSILSAKEVICPF